MEVGDGQSLEWMSAGSDHLDQQLGNHPYGDQDWRLIVCIGDKESPNRNRQMGKWLHGDWDEWHSNGYKRTLYKIYKLSKFSADCGLHG